MIPRPPLPPLSGEVPADVPLGLGTAPLGNLFSEVTADDAAATIRTAWERGIRTFDTAPLYGYGQSERRLGEILRDYPRDEYVVSTKVGRLIRRGAPPSPEQISEGQHFYKVADDINPVFDFSFDGVMRSVEESLERLQLDRIDMLYLHDPDDHYKEAVAGAYLALDSLRQQGLVRGIGVGMNQVQMLIDFARMCDFDYFLVAGRYTLLDQSADAQLFDDCVDGSIGVVAGGVFNSGILAAPSETSTYDYVPAPEPILAAALKMEQICLSHGVPLAAAAMQYPARHPVVSSVLIGARTADEVNTNCDLYELPIPEDLWSDLIAEQLLPGHPTTTPSSAPSGASE